MDVLAEAARQSVAASKRHRVDAPSQVQPKRTRGATARNDGVVVAAELSSGGTTEVASDASARATTDRAAAGLAASSHATRLGAGEVTQAELPAPTSWPGRRAPRPEESCPFCLHTYTVRDGLSNRRDPVSGARMHLRKCQCRTKTPPCRNCPRCKLDVKIMELPSAEAQRAACLASGCEICACQCPASGKWIEGDAASRAKFVDRARWRCRELGAIGLDWAGDASKACGPFAEAIREEAARERAAPPTSETTWPAAPTTSTAGGAQTVVSPGAVSGPSPLSPPLGRAGATDAAAAAAAVAAAAAATAAAALPAPGLVAALRREDSAATLRPLPSPVSGSPCEYAHGIKADARSSVPPGVPLGALGALATRLSPGVDVGPGWPADVGVGGGGAVDAARETSHVDTSSTGVTLPKRLPADLRDRIRCLAVKTSLENACQAPCASAAAPAASQRPGTAPHGEHGETHACHDPHAEDLRERSSSAVYAGWPTGHRAAPSSALHAVAPVATAGCSMHNQSGHAAQHGGAEDAPMLCCRAGHDHASGQNGLHVHNCSHPHEECTSECCSAPTAPPPSCLPDPLAAWRAAASGGLCPPAGPPDRAALDLLHHILHGNAGVLPLGQHAPPPHGVAALGSATLGPVGLRSLSSGMPLPEYMGLLSAVAQSQRQPGVIGSPGYAHSRMSHDATSVCCVPPDPEETQAASSRDAPDAAVLALVEEVFAGAVGSVGTQAVVDFLNRQKLATLTDVEFIELSWMRAALEPLGIPAMLLNKFLTLGRRRASAGGGRVRVGVSDSVNSGCEVPSASPAETPQKLDHPMEPRKSNAPTGVS